MAECDLVTIIHKNYRQDPTAAPGTWFEAYTFDTFRVRNGKLVEHWDSAVINPPAPAAAPAGRGSAQSAVNSRASIAERAALALF